MKKCPFCAEEIQEEAIKCKHCFEFLDPALRPVSPPPLPAGPPKLPWYFSTSFIVLMFISLPPFALPSVWLHPRLHLVWKLLITAAATAFCWAAYQAINGFVQQYDEVLQMFREGGVL